MKLTLITVVLLLGLSEICLAQKIDGINYQISLAALNYLKENDIESFKNLMDSSVVIDISEETFSNFTDEAGKVLNIYDIPNKETLLLESNSITYKGKKINIESIIFPFGQQDPTSIISDYQIVFIFSEDFAPNKILGFKIRDFASFRSADK